MNPLGNNDKRNLEPENSTLNNNEAVNKKQNLGLHPPLNNEMYSLPNMPPLVKCMIFRELEKMEDVRSLANTCKSLNHVFQHNSIWKAFHDRIFPERKDVEPKGYYAICKKQQNLINKVTFGKCPTKSKNYNDFNWKERPLTHWELKGTNLVIDSYENTICNFLDLKTDDTFSVDLRDCKVRFVRNLMFLIDKKKGLEIWDLNTKSKCMIEEIDFFNWNYPCEKANITHIRNNIPLNGKISLESLSNNYQLLIRPIKENDNKIIFSYLDIKNGKLHTPMSITCDITNQKDELPHEINIEIDENDFLCIRHNKTNKETFSTKTFTYLRNLNNDKPIYFIKNIEQADVTKFIGCETSLKTNYIFALLNDKSISVRDLENKPICHLKDVEFNLDNDEIKQKFIYEHLLLAPKASDKCTIAIWDLAKREQIGCLVHYDEQNQPAEIMQIEKRGESLVTISKKTIKIWNVIDQSCFHVGNLDNEEPYRTKLVFGNYLVDTDRGNNTLSSWNIKTKTHSKFYGVRTDLLEGVKGKYPFGSNMQAKGNLLAMHELHPYNVNFGIWDHGVFIFDLENNFELEHRLPEQGCNYQIDWLESGMIVLRPYGNQDQENPNCQILEF